MKPKEPTDSKRSDAGDPADRPPEYIRPCDPRSHEISPLVRASTLFHGQEGVSSITTLFLVSLTATDGLRFPRALLFLLDGDRLFLRGVGALAAGGRRPVRLADLLDRFAEIRANEHDDPKAVPLCRSTKLEREIHRLRYRIEERSHPVVEALVTGRTVTVEESEALESLDAQLRALLEGGPFAALPVPSAGRGIGVAVVPLEREDPVVRRCRLSMVGELAGHAGEAIEHARLATERRQQDRLLAAADEVARSCLSATRLEEALKLVVRSAVEVIEAQAGAAWVYDEANGRLRLAATAGGKGGAASDLLLAATAWVERAVEERRPVALREEEGPSAPRSFLCSPLIAFDEVVGAIGLLRKSGSGPFERRYFDERDERLLQVFAAQAAGAVQNARLFERVRESSRRLQEAERLVLHTEKLAALGEMSAKMTHEIRNPLSAIGGFARRIVKGLAADDPSHGYAAIIVREIARLESILSEQLQLAGASRPHLEMMNLGPLIRETIQLVRDEAERKGVRLLDQVSGGMPEMLLDGDRLKQVLLNILKNAIESTRKGEQIRLHTKVSDGWVQIEIANNGERLPGEILDQLFVPFATTRERGIGLGLAVADQIVKEHGGEIRVRSTEEWSVVFTVSLPIRTNEDRRRAPDRRRGRDRRRAA